MSVLVPFPSASSARSGRVLAPGATPSTPTPLPASAAMIPVTCVPCPFSSWGVPSFCTKSQPGRSRPARSGWEASTPESTTATTAPVPFVARCAASASIMSSPHCRARSGSPAPAAGADAASAATSKTAIPAPIRRIGSPSVRPGAALPKQVRPSPVRVGRKGAREPRVDLKGESPGRPGPVVVLVAVFEDEDLEAHVRVEDHLAVVPDHAATGGLLHRGLELVGQHVLERDPRLAHQVVFAGLDERLLGGGQHVLEHAEDVVVEQVRLRLRR